MSFPRGRVWLVLAIVVLSSLGACGGDGGSGEEAGGAATPAAQDGDAGSDAGGGASGSGGASATPGAGGGAPGQTGAAGDPNARFNLVASPDNVECNYVPNGHLNGSDLLNVHFYFLIIGGNPPDVPLLRVVGTSDTGLQTSYNAGPHNQAVSSAQFALRNEDFGRGHAITVTVDASNQVSETDESDNRISVSVELPSPRPANTVDPLPCSAARG